MKDLAQRRHLLFTTLTACSWRETPGGPTRVVAGLRQYLGGSLGIGRIVVGMARQSYDLQLTRYGEEGWRATFYPAGRGHSATSAVGSAWERVDGMKRLTPSSTWWHTLPHRENALTGA